MGSEQVGIIVHPNAEPTVQLTGARSEMNLNQDVHSQSAVSRISGAGGGAYGAETETAFKKEHYFLGAVFVVIAVLLTFRR